MPTTTLIKRILWGLQPVPTNQSDGCKALTALLETSITDGLKSRLTQYLKHVVEDDALFTNSNPLQKDVCHQYYFLVRLCRDGLELNVLSHG